MQEIEKRAVIEEEVDNLKKDKLQLEETLKRMENMLEEANNLYQEMEKQLEEGRQRDKALKLEVNKAKEEIEETTANLLTERNALKESLVREQELSKKLQVSEESVLALKDQIRQMEEKAELTRRASFNSLLLSQANGTSPEGVNEEISNGAGDMSSIIEQEKKEIEKLYKGLDEERAKFREESKSFESQHKMFLEDLHRITEEKSTLMMKTAELIKDKKVFDDLKKQWESQRKSEIQQQHEVPKDKSITDNELRKLVEQRIELQQIRKQLEEKDVVITELETKLKETELKLTTSTKHSEALEQKLSTPSTPTTPVTPSTPTTSDRFSIFSKSKKEASEVFVSQATNDEERKKLLFEEYTNLLTEVNNTLFQKREALTELESKEGNKFLKKLPLSNLKSAIAKLEALQEKTKKALRGVDEKASITLQSEYGEYSNLKTLKSELENV